MSLAWKIYYSNTTYTNLDGPVEKAPALDVQAIIQADEVVGRYILSRYDFYWFENEQWYGSDNFGVWDYLQRPGWKRVLFGRSLPNKIFEMRWRDVLADTEFAPKSGWLPQENGPRT